MTDFTVQVLKRINERNLKLQDLGSDEILPDYDGLSLVNIPSAICQLLGVPPFGKAPLDKTIIKPIDGPYEKVVLLLVDALGYNLLNRLMDRGHHLMWGRFLERGVYCPITSVCPSTTSSALTTLWTGEGPAAHGIIGYEMWAREFGMVINNILHCAASARGDLCGLARSGFDARTFLPSPLLGTHLDMNGILPTAFLHTSIVHSGLSTMQMKDVNLNAFVDEADLCVSLAEHVNRRKGIRDFIYVYYSDIDTLMHRFSAQDARVDLQFTHFSFLFFEAFIKKLSKEVGKDVLLILTSDHGSMTTPKNDHYNLEYHPELMDHLVMQPTCENRLAFLYVKPGRVGAVRDYFKKVWPEKFDLVDSGEALESGLFGSRPFHQQVRDRLGDLVVIARADAYLWWAPKPNHMAGRHGGLSVDEMLVPFYALPLHEVI